mgnify:CR=1 FL=1
MQVFFKMFTTLVLVAVFAGLITLPVILSYVGPASYGTDYGKGLESIQLATEEKKTAHGKALNENIPVAQVMSVK